MKKQTYRGKIVQIFQQKQNIINLAMEASSDNTTIILKFSGFSIHQYEYHLQDEIVIEGIFAWHKIYGKVIKGTIQPKHIRPIQKERNNLNTHFNQAQFLTDITKLDIKVKSG